MFDIPTAEQFLSNWVTNLQRDRFSENFGSDTAYVGDTYGSEGTSTNAITAGTAFFSEAISIFISTNDVYENVPVTFYLDFGSTDYSVVYKNQLDIAYATAVTDETGGYQLLHSFTLDGTYQVKAVITQISTGNSVTTLNTLSVVVQQV
tara:strand:- start:235 stop:681 length:447 start_codon:yes stop_codon:yes gene_type:complete